ncbi:response regulator [uncultured Marivirga sp.]|uniref:response regulator n=1 Tax=uncultured Marivirga sp. TaxID=1123707 RepID=UPI0030EF5FF2|tara:strand:- start:57476 stop:57856 length:381 start_codon:yes stop_codon:yes gene_type:complete
MKHTILIIEDDEPMRLLLDVLLKKNHKLVFKNDGLDGMRWLSEGNIPSVIISDFKTPNMNGFDFFTSISQSGMFSEIPFVFISCRTDEAFKNRCLKLGAKGYLEKPFDPDQLYDLLDGIFNDKIEQ